MNVWMMIQERLVYISILSVILVASLVLLWATWKNRQALPTILTIFSTIICLALILLSMYGLVFVMSFGYNS